MSRRRPAQAGFLALLAACGWALAAGARGRVAYSPDPHASGLADVAVLAPAELEQACLRAGSALADVPVPAAVWTWEGRTYAQFDDEAGSLSACASDIREPGLLLDGTVAWESGAADVLAWPGGFTRPPPPWVDDVAAVTVPALSDPLARDRSWRSALLAGESEAIDTLVRASPATALVGVDLLARAGGAGASPILERMVREHPDHRVRARVLPLLSDRVDPLSDRAVHDPEADVRLLAVRLLARFDERLALLRERLPVEPDPLVRRQWVWTTGLAGVPSVSDLLSERQTADPDVRVRAAALGALGQGGELSDATLLAAASDPQPLIRATATDLLVDLSRRALLPVLWARLSDDDLGVRAAASRLLDDVDDPEIAPAVWQRYVADADLLAAPSDHLQRLVEFVARHPDPRVTPQVADRFGATSSPLEKWRLARLWVRLDPVGASAVLAPILLDREHRWRPVALATAPASESVDRLRRQLLDSDDPETAAGAWWGLCDHPQVSASLRRLPVQVWEGTGPLSGAARAVRGVCPPSPRADAPRWRTRLARGLADPDRSGRWGWAAGASVLLLAVGLVLRRRRGRRRGRTPS